MHVYVCGCLGVGVYVYDCVHERVYVYVRAQCVQYLEYMQHV